MHTFFARLNMVFFFSMSILFLAGLGCSLSYVTQTGPASRALEDVAISGVTLQYPKPFRGAVKGMEYGLVEFDLHADLRPLWNWNTKQLLVSVVAVYTPASTRVYGSNAHRGGKPVEQALWSRIISAEGRIGADGELHDGPESSLINERITWESVQPMKEAQHRGRELGLLATPKSDLHALRSNTGSIANRTVTLRLQYEVYPLIGSTFLGRVDSKTTQLKIEKSQQLFVHN
jgi:hypothetical protein